MNSLRRGMQVHAVPENERAFGPDGRRLPWGFELADSDLNRRREPEEKGPFGRATRRRGFSRTKTVTPARKEDAARLENWQLEDAIFNQHKETQKTRESTTQTQHPRNHQTQQQQDPDFFPERHSPPSQDRTKSKESMSAIGSSIASRALSSLDEPTEVLLYGYGTDQQWAAIEYFERVSGGIIYEDYDRHSPHQRYDHSLATARPRALQRSTSVAVLQKSNSYKGGNHWIKVTFDSANAAEMACHASPHALYGYLVYAEPYRGVPPPQDAPIPHSNAGAQLNSTTLPASLSTRTPAFGLERTASGGSSSLALPSFRSEGGMVRSTTVPNLGSRDVFSSSSVSTSTALDHRPASSPQQRPLRIPGATRAVLLPAEQAFMPTRPRYVSMLAAWPLIGLLFSGGTEQNNAVATPGSQVPRKEDGSFDWATASFYWCFFAWLDALLGTDMCGLKGDE